MKRFPIKVILLSLFIVINLTVICTFPTSMSDNDSEEVVNNLVTFLNKNDITVSPTIIDKETKKVSSATLQNFIEDRDAFAKNILGAKKEVTKNGETYTANENQVIFDGNKFSFIPKTPVALSETHGIDAVNASKKGKKIAAYYGFDSQNALIVSSDDNGKYHIFMTYTIENLPVFNDYMTFDITSDGLMGFSGVWFTQNSLGEYRNAKSVADALLEFSASKDKPNGKIEISDITLGYNIVDFDTSPTELQPVWRITLKDGSKYYINA